MKKVLLRKSVLVMVLCMAALILAACTYGEESNAPEAAVQDSGAVTEDFLVTPAESEQSDMPDERKDEVGQDTEADITAEADRTETVEEPVPETEEKKVKIVLDPGHGGCFSGANHYERSEKDVVLKLAEYVRDYINENSDNIEVLLTRETDDELSADIVKDLEMRAEFAEHSGADILISLHLNASQKHDATGGMVYISNRAHVNERSGELAGAILSELEKLGIKNRGVKTRNSNDMFDEDGKALDYYAINRHCANRNIAGIIVEHCFMDNADDVAFIADEDAIRRLAEADARGIISYINSLD